MDPLFKFQPEMPRGCLIGCSGFPVAKEKIFQNLHCIEYVQSFFEPPSDKRLNQLYKSAPPSFFFIVKAWQCITHLNNAPSYRRIKKPLSLDLEQCGHFLPGPTLDMAYEETRRVASRLHAPAILFETPSSFVPSALHRKRLESFFTHIDRDNRLMIWEPNGLWQAKEILPICKSLKVIPSYDPMLHKASPIYQHSFAYFKLMGLGQYRKNSITNLSWLKTLSSQYELTIFIFNTPSMWPDALQFKRLLLEN